MCTFKLSLLLLLHSPLFLFFFPLFFSASFKCRSLSSSQILLCSSCNLVLSFSLSCSSSPRTYTNSFTLAQLLLTSCSAHSTLSVSALMLLMIRLASSKVFPTSNGNASETKANKSFDNGVFFDIEAKRTPSIVSKLFLKQSKQIR